jgi:hypothetical protein
LFLWTERGTLWLEIADHGHLRPAGPHTTGRGRGISLMQRLVDAVSIHHDSSGTRVLLRHSLPSHTRIVTPHHPAPPNEDMVNLPDETTPPAT